MHYWAGVDIGKGFTDFFEDDGCSSLWEFLTFNDLVEKLPTFEVLGDDEPLRFGFKILIDFEGIRVIQFLQNLQLLVSIIFGPTLTLPNNLQSPDTWQLPILHFEHLSEWPLS